VPQANKDGRTELLRLHREGAIRDETLHTLERESDLEEMNVLGYLAEGATIDRKIEKAQES